MFFPWLAWSPKGDRIAYFVRTEKERTLIVQNVLTKNIEVRIPMKSVDEPESPAFSPDGRTVTFSALRGGVGDIYTVDLETEGGGEPHDRRVRRLRADLLAGREHLSSTTRASAGTTSCSGWISPRRRKPSSPSARTTTAACSSSTPHTVVFSSTATDPATPLDADTARNGHIFNIWTLDLTNGELRQYTDTLGGNTSPIVLNEGTTRRVAFLTYYKADYEVHTLELKEPLHTVASADFGEPGPIIDFQAPVQHTFDANKVHKKKTFEKMFLEGRPPVNVGVTSNGDIFGGTAISFGDVLGDKQFNVFISSISTYRTLQATYVNLSRRFQWALAGDRLHVVLLRQHRGRLLRPGVRRAHLAGSGHRHADGPRRQRARHLAAQPLPPPPGLGGLPADRGGLLGSIGAGALRRSMRRQRVSRSSATAR